MSGKKKLTIEEIISSDRPKINADEDSIFDKKFSNLNKRKTVVYFTCQMCGKKNWISLEKALKKFNNKCQGCKTKETTFKKYGVENISQLEKNRKKLSKLMTEKNINGSFKKILLKKYGVENSFNIPNIREKNKQSLKSKEHKEYMKQYNLEHPEASLSKSLKMKNFYLDKNNKEKIKIRNQKIKNKLNSKSKNEKQLIKNKRNQTMFEKYNTSNIVSLKETEKTCLKKYNSKTYVGSSAHKEYMKQYRLEHPEKFHQHGKHRYSINNLFFDSKCELDFYIFCKENNINCIRNTEYSFEYIFNNTTHKYFPDFKINDEFIEIKGEQFLKEDGSWQNPYNHKLDTFYEAKHQCALLHNVKIIYSEDIENYKSQLLSANPHNSLNLGSE